MRRYKASHSTYSTSAPTWPPLSGLSPAGVVQTGDHVSPSGPALYKPLQDSLILTSALAYSQLPEIISLSKFFVFTNLTALYKFDLGILHSVSFMTGYFTSDSVLKLYLCHSTWHNFLLGMSDSSHMYTHYLHIICAYMYTICSTFCFSVARHCAVSAFGYCGCTAMSMDTWEWDQLLVLSFPGLCPAGGLLGISLFFSI